MPVKNAKGPTSTKPNPALEQEEPFSPFSIQGIRSGAAKMRVVKILIVVSGLIMAFGLALTSLNPGAQMGRNGGGGTAPTGTAAVVGSQTITNGDLDRAFGSQLQMNERYGMPTGVTNFLQAKFGALQGLTDNAANIIAAQNAGISVSDEEIDKKIDSLMKDEFKPQGGMSEAAFRRQVEAEYGSMDEARKKIREGFDRDKVRDQLLLDKLEKQVKDANKVTEDDYKRSVTRLKLWQIVIRPKFATMGAKDYQQQQDKNKADAKAKADKIYAELKANPNLAAFKAAAMKNSDDDATKKKGGDVGWKLPTEVYYPTDAGQALSKFANQLAPPLYDDSGAAYIYFIEARKTELPKDYAKNKKKLISDFETTSDNDAWSKKQQEYKKAVTPDIYSPELAAYQIQSQNMATATGDDQKKLRDEAIDRYTQAVAGLQGMEASAVYYQLSELYRAAGDKAKTEEALSNAVKQDGNDAQLLLEYARALREDGKGKDAVVQLKAASKALDDHPSAPSMFSGYDPAAGVRQQIAGEFEMNKEPALAAAERKKMPKPGANPGGGMFGGNNIQIH